MHQASQKGSLRERLYVKALEFSERYADAELHCDSNVRATFSALRDLVKFFDEYHEQKYQLALETLSQLRLVPLNVNELEICVNNFKRCVYRAIDGVRFVSSMILNGFYFGCSLHLQTRW